MSGRLIADPGDVRAVPGFDGRYVVDYEGQVYRRWKTGYTVRRQQQKGKRLILKLTRPDGVLQEMTVARIVQLAWLGPCPPGMVRYHKNGSSHDNCVGNFITISRAELARRTVGRASMRAVVKVDPETGEVLEVYASATQAGRENYLSRATVTNCCKGVTKCGQCADGYRYLWQDDVNDQEAAE